MRTEGRLARSPPCPEPLHSPRGPGSSLYLSLASVSPSRLKTRRGAGCRQWSRRPGSASRDPEHQARLWRRCTAGRRASPSSSPPARGSSRVSDLRPLRRPEPPTVRSQPDRLDLDFESPLGPPVPPAPSRRVPGSSSSSSSRSGGARNECAPMAGPPGCPETRSDQEPTGRKGDRLARGLPVQRQLGDRRGGALGSSRPPTNPACRRRKGLGWRWRGRAGSCVGVCLRPPIRAGLPAAQGEPRGILCSGVPVCVCQHWALVASLLECL